MAGDWRSMKKKIENIKAVGRSVEAMKTISSMKLSCYERQFIQSETNLGQLNAAILRFITSTDYSAVINVDSGSPLLIAMIGNQSLCGGYNDIVNDGLKSAISSLYDRLDAKVNLVLLGSRFDISSVNDKVRVITNLDYTGSVDNIAARIMEELQKFSKSRVFILSGTKATISNKKVALDDLKPEACIYKEGHEDFLKQPAVNISSVNDISMAEPQYLVSVILEGDKDMIMKSMITEFKRSLIVSKILSSLVGINFARTIAMNNAEQNSKQLVQELSMKSNKMRQEVITSEISDITNSVTAVS